jgi:flagellin-like hook-associated protein FlgL
MVDVTISAGTRSALLALSSMQDQASVMENRLATGRRVNAPIDNAISYFLSAGLSSRANAINGLMSDITNTQGSIAAANNGITAIRALLTTAQTIASQAKQFPEAPVVVVTGSHSTGFSAASTIASTAGSGSLLKAGDTVTVGDGTTTATYTAANGDTIQALLDTVNNTGGLNVTATLNGSGQLKFTATSAANITIGGSVTGGVGHGTLYGILGLDPGTAVNTANIARANLATQFDDVLARINEVAADAGFNGVNFLTGSSSTINFNEAGTSSLVISGSPATSSALGVAASTNYFEFNTDVDTAVNNIIGALNSLKSIATTIGSVSTIMQTRMDFNKSMINTLGAGAEALTISDVNEDSAKLLALQTRRQMASTSLRLSSNNDNAVLRLFGQ